MCKNEKSTHRTRAWRERNRAKHNRYMREYRDNPIDVMLGDPDELWFERNARKRKLMKLATPGWVDKDRVRAIYRKCAELNRQYPGTGFVIHHDIPISHPNVCGLHVEDNLRVVSKNLKAGLGRGFKN